MLPEAPSTALLNRVEQDLNLEVDAIDIDLIDAPTIEPTRREPRTHKALDGTVYIEILVKKEKGKGRTGWYWQHGTEFEVQNRPKEGKNPRVWVCDKCKAFQSYLVGGSVHIVKHLKSHNLHEKQAPRQRISIAERLSQHTPAMVDDRPLAEADRKAIHARKFEEALVAFIYSVHIAFSIVENKFFIALLVAVSNLVPHILP
jgi:hypothetical protein